MTAMIYMLFYCSNSGLCVENGGFTFRSSQGCIAYMIELGKGHDVTLKGARLFIGSKPYTGWYECMRRPQSQWEPVQ